MRIFGPRRDENGEWRSLNNKELHGLYSSPNIVSMINSKILRWLRHFKIKIYKIITLPVLLYGCETWSLTLREVCDFKVFENRIRGVYLGPRGMRMGNEEGSTLRNFVVCTIHLMYELI